MVTQILIFIIVFAIYAVFSAAGGIGLLVRPLLIFFGVPPDVAIATHRIAHLGSRFTGLVEFHKHDKIDWSLGLWLMIPSMIGGWLGTEFVLRVDQELLTKIIGIGILFGGVLLVWKKNVGVETQERTRSIALHCVGWLTIVVSSILATVTGGSGILSSYALIFLYGKTYLTSVATRKVSGLGGAISSLAIFWTHGTIDWILAPTVLVACGLGTYVGVRYAIAKGDAWARRVMLTAIFIVGTVMLFS